MPHIQYYQIMFSLYFFLFKEVLYTFLTGWKVDCCSVLSGEWLLTLASSSNDCGREGLSLLSRGMTDFWGSASVEISQTYKPQMRICLFNISERKTATNSHQLTAL